MTSQDPVDDWIKPAAAMRMVGVGDSRTVRGMAQRGQIIGLRLPSGHWLFSRSSIEHMIERNITRRQAS